MIISNNMKEGFEHQTLGPVLSQSVVALLKRDLQKIHFASFPTYLVYGEPGTGKTPLVNAATICDEDVNLQMSHKELKNKLKELQFNAINLDDCAQLTTSIGRQRQFQNLDTSIRASYNGTGPVITVTAETKAIKKLPLSAKMRMIPIRIGKGLLNEELSELVSFLQFSGEFQQFMKEFSLFYKGLHFDLSNELKHYRYTHPNKGGEYAKRVDMVFCYSLSMKFVYQFCLENGIMLDLKKIEKIELQLLEAQIEDFFFSRASTTEKVVEYMIYNGFVKAKIPVIKDLCNSYLLNGCESYSPFDCCQEGNCCSKCKRILSGYDPSKIALKLDGEENTVLVRNSKLLASFRREYNVPPFLIIETNYFEHVMNMALNSLCEEEKRKGIYFNSISLKKDLHSLNRIMVTPNADKGYRFTHSFVGIDKDGNEKSIRVVLLMLKEEEAEYLQIHSTQEVSNIDYFEDYFDENKNHSTIVNSHILQNWSQVTFWAGANIGELGEKFE